jgi:thiamine-phosphate pyrophosphorylase
VSADHATAESGRQASPVAALAARIAAAHAALQVGAPLPLAPCLRPADAALPPLAAAAIAAARSLGFVEADAAVVARAWQARHTRRGHAAADLAAAEAALDAWPDDPADHGLEPWPRAEAFAPCPQALGLYTVLPDAAWVARMAQAGVPTLQLRCKSDDAARVRAEVRAAVRAVAGTPARLFVNDHWRLAIDEGAYGVHLGQEDLAGADLDAIRAAGLRLGLSTHGYAEIVRAERCAPSYLALGAVYPTTLKAMPTAPQGPARLAAYARLLRGRPLVAIGGIDEARLPAVLASGVGAVAVVRAIVGAADPEAAARRLMHAIAAAAPPPPPGRQTL